MQERFTNTIPQVENPNKKKFFQLWQTFQPFIIKGVVDKWDACKNWSNDYLVDQCGEKELNIEYYPTKNLKIHEYTNEDCYQNCSMKLKDYIELVRQKHKKDIQKYYLAQLNFETNFPELVKDLDYPDYLKRKRNVAFWFGFANEDCGTVSYLHYDNPHNLFAQIRGRKKILLYCPTSYLSFYPSILEKSGLPSFSKVNPNELNYDLFPKFPWQSKIEVILEAGDMLYIPPFWWHHVTALEENISLSFWYNIRPKDIIKQQKLLATYLNILIEYSQKKYFKIGA